MFDPQLRIIKDRLLAPVAGRLGFVSPDALTLLALVLGLGSAWAAWEGRFDLGLALWAGNRVLDGLDGLVARTHSRTTDFGGVLDLVADFAVYAAIPLALALRPGAEPELAGAAALLVASFYVNAASWMVPSAILERRGASAPKRATPTAIAIPEGLVSGGETILLFVLFFLLPEHQLLLFHLMAALTAVTVLQRLVWARGAFEHDSGSD